MSNVKVLDEECLKYRSHYALELVIFFYHEYKNPLATHQHLKKTVDFESHYTLSPGGNLLTAPEVPHVTLKQLPPISSYSLGISGQKLNV